MSCSGNCSGCRKRREAVEGHQDYGVEYTSVSPGSDEQLKDPLRGAWPEAGCGKRIKSARHIA